MAETTTACVKVRACVHIHVVNDGGAIVPRYSSLQIFFPTLSFYIFIHAGDCKCYSTRCLFSLFIYFDVRAAYLIFLHIFTGDSHSDCQTGLICFQRNGGDAVPFCDGSDSSANDYCTLPALNDIGNGLSSGSYDLCQVRQ